MAYYSTINFTSLMVGIILGIFFVFLLIFSINTSLSIVDSDNCFRHGIITKKGYVCSLIKKEFKLLVQEHCPDRFNRLLMYDFCKGI